MQSSVVAILVFLCYFVRVKFAGPLPMILARLGFV